MSMPEEISTARGHGVRWALIAVGLVVAYVLSMAPVMAVLWVASPKSIKSTGFEVGTPTAVSRAADFAYAPMWWVMLRWEGGYVAYGRYSAWCNRMVGQPDDDMMCWEAARAMNGLR